MLLAILAATAVPGWAPARCDVITSTLFQGVCEVRMEPGGSFAMRPAKGGPKTFNGATVVTVTLTGKGVAEVRGLTPAGVNSRWGEVRRGTDRSCWEGSDFTVCARAAGAAGPAAARPAPGTRTVTVRLTGYEMGDFAWLKWKDAAGKAQDGLCNAAPCDGFGGALPKKLVGRRARLTLRPTKIDGGGEMIATDAVTRIELLD